MIIEVTQDHIDRGNQGDCEYCPIAIAIRATLKDYSISVGGTIFEYKNSYYKLPEKAMKFVQAFDNTLPVQPFTFELTFESAD